MKAYRAILGDGLLLEGIGRDACFRRAKDAVIEAYYLTEHANDVYDGQIQWNRNSEARGDRKNFEIMHGDMNGLRFYVAVETVDVPDGTEFTFPRTPKHLTSDHKKLARIYGELIETGKSGEWKLVGQ